MKNFGYVTAFVVPVPRSKVAKYKQHAKEFGKVWMKYGALEYVECFPDDVKPGKVTSFPQAVKAKKGEIVVLAFVKYKNRAHRDRVMKKVMSDPVMTEFDYSQMPFDGMRMFWGGFKPAVKF